MIRMLVLLFLLGLLGCASTQEIETSPPMPRTGVADEAETSQEAPLSIVMGLGETALPGDVSHLRFRVAEIRLRQSADGEWIRLPSDTAPVEVVEDTRNVRKTLLEARIAPVAYDSLSIVFDDVFVRFGTNAGGPLTTGREAPHQLALGFEPEPGVLTRVMLTLEPGASLTRSPDCRWFFVPVLMTELAMLPMAPTDFGQRQ